MHTTGDYVKLHFLVLLFGFTGILGKLVSIPVVEMVFYRTLLATVGVGIVIFIVRGSFKVSSSDFLKLMLTGFIVGIHWLAFFISARVANVSVSLVGFATASLWTALLEPLVKKYPMRKIDMLFGFIVLAGLYIIFSSDFSYSLGLILGVASGLTCAAFSIINSQLVHRIDAFTITFYEMIGACIFLIIFSPLYRMVWAEGNQFRLVPSFNDWICIALLAWLCSVYAYSASIQMMKKISVFLFQLTLNLEPIYGIIMAVLVFGEVEKMNINFYIGAAIIMCMVFLYPMMSRRFTTFPTNTPSENS